MAICEELEGEYNGTVRGILKRYDAESCLS